MTKHSDSSRGSGDDRMVARIAEGYAPRPLAPARRVQLEEELWDRIERRRSRRYLTPVLAMAAAAVAMLALPWGRQLEQGMAPADPTATAAATTAAGESDTEWEYALLYPGAESYASAELDRDRGLPEEYLGIADLLADG